jgi:WD40 repeat protein
MIRMRMADSGALVGQCRGSSGSLNDVGIGMKAGMVMGAYDSGLWIWSFPVVVDGPPRAIATPRNIHNPHSSSIESIAFSEDGLVAVSCSPTNPFVVVWDTATGMRLRQLDIDLPRYHIRPRAVAIANNGEWVLCTGETERYDGKDAFVKLWGPSNEEFVGRVKSGVEVRDKWAAMILSSLEPQVHGAIMVEREGNAYETFTWALSGSDPEIIVLATATPKDVESK